MYIFFLTMVVVSLFVYKKQNSGKTMQELTEVDVVQTLTEAHRMLKKFGIELSSDKKTPFFLELWSGFDGQEKK